MTALKLIGRRNVTIVTPLNRFNDLNRVSRSVLIQMISRGTNLAENWVWLQDKPSFVPEQKNRRTQLKAQHERADNNALKAENDKIRCENKAIREALKHAICLNCGGPPVSEDPYFDEHKLRIENAHFRDELKRMSTVAPNYMGRPISSHLSTLHPMHISPLDLSMAGASLDFDLLPGSYMHYQPNNLATISDMDKPLMNDIALTAMEELLRLF
ncbi:PREDICTED: homeobox-leucine zipper protein HDG11-like [Brassica oleracea var. oleracea]|uniref:homeobox-leucine zipper protein HDG11-like n=1 Tax=Brassica oleracea var. oleracea TaxID=109376 RepID=UPI0006A6C49F|nr:PREDICTED: homeobox-leucine zipper protein HDG11-like [Brassica oleracea var. oleracea]